MKMLPHSGGERSGQCGAPRRRPAVAATRLRGVPHASAQHLWGGVLPRAPLRTDALGKPQSHPNAHSRLHGAAAPPPASWPRSLEWLLFTTLDMESASRKRDLAAQPGALGHLNKARGGRAY